MFPEKNYLENLRESERMKVSALIKKLQKMPQDAEVTVDNSEMYFDGTYKATSVEFYDEENIITIETDYARRLVDGKWLS